MKRLNKHAQLLSAAVVAFAAFGCANQTRMPAGTQVAADNGPAPDADHEKFHAAIDKCVAQLGLPKPQPGEKHEPPTEQQRKAMDACLVSHGVTPPRFDHHHGFHHGRFHHEEMDACLKESGVTLPPFEPGAPRPKLTEAQRDAFDACRDKLERKKCAENDKAPPASK